MFYPQVSAWANWYTNGDVAPFTYFASTMNVPPLPNKEWETLFIWPGLQPGGSKTYYPIDNGVLQPVLTYGDSCAPNPSNASFNLDKTWWISGQYVNTIGREPGFTGCYGGDRVPVRVGDELRMVMELKKTIWIQTIYINGKHPIIFKFDLKGQTQAWAIFMIEPANGWHSNPPRFNVTNIELRATKADPSFCWSQVDLNTVNTPPNTKGISIQCTNTIVTGNICKVKSCEFNIKRTKYKQPDTQPKPPVTKKPPTHYQSDPNGLSSQ
eukprot:NODE_518_length_6556_cov_0.505653.p4 type:complete len:268 gc:universal NODE_518_length_6556_cov_0.505653:6457-5654(-)